MGIELLEFLIKDNLKNNIEICKIKLLSTKPNNQNSFSIMVNSTVVDSHIIINTEDYDDPFKNNFPLDLNFNDLCEIITDNLLIDIEISIKQTLIKI